MRLTLINLNLMYARVGGRIDFDLYAPLGLLSIAASLEERGFEVDYRDFQRHVRDHQGDPFDLDAFAAFVQGSAQVIGLSCMSNLLPFAILAAERLKADDPTRIVILGGVGPTGVPREIMDRFPFVDLVAEGEGEASMVELAQRLAEGWRPGDSLVAGFHQRWEGGIASIPCSLIPDLDALPLPAYHHVDPSETVFSVLTSRGCPYRCAFCSERNHWGGGVRFKSLDRVMTELRLVADLGPLYDTVVFQDDQLTLNRSRAMALFDGIRQADLGLSWKCFVRVDRVDAELLEAMAAAGCVQVRFGVESGSNRVLERIHKGFTIEEAHSAVKLALRYFPSVHASFIWGYPFETLRECRQTLKWVRRLQDDGATVLNFMLSPLPNTEIYREYAGRLDFREETVAVFVGSGGEDVGLWGTRIHDTGRRIYDLVRAHPRVFPGFYVYDYRRNILPKSMLVHGRRHLIYRGLKSMGTGERQARVDY